MLLRNWINSSSGRIAGNDNGIINRWKDTQGRITQYGVFGDGGSAVYTQEANCNNYVEHDYGSTSGSASPQYMRICLGSGSTPPTFDDYKMENAIVGILDSANVSSPYASSGQTFDSYSHLTWTQTVINYTNNNVTVNEIGIFGCLLNSTTQNKPCVLYTRDVIDPVTITPGEAKTFVVTIDLTQMSTNVNAS